MKTSVEGLAISLDTTLRTGGVNHVALNAGEVLAFEPEHWRDALVLVQHGSVRLECRSGGCAVFPTGAILYLDGLSLNSIIAEEEPVLLLALRPPSQACPHANHIGR